MEKTKGLSRWQMIRILRKHGSLADKRNVAIEQNKVAKVFGYVMAVVIMLYLMFIAVMLSLIANSSSRYTASELMFGILPFILVADFLFRFMGQQTPSQRIKPYILLPLGKYACIDCFLFNSATSPANLIWLGLFIPYAIMSIVFVEGFFSALGFILAVYLLIVANSLWYMIARTLINKNILWWGLPLAVYASIFSPWYIGRNADFVQLCETYAIVGRGASHWSILVFGGILLLIYIVWIVNRRVQYDSIYSELSRSEKTKIHHVSQLSLFDKYGEVGEYLKLEVKSIMRNKNIRKTFIMANVFIIMFSLLISFTDMYDGGMTKFLAVYNFAVFGAMILVKVMCYEGNYIDCIMIHKENILSLIKAKYFLYTALLILPLLLMLPTVVMEKCSLIMLVSIMFLVGGPIHACFLYLAIINKQTIPLNTKFIGKGTMENNYIQIVIEFGAFLFPLILLNLLPALMGETSGALVILGIGLAFMLTYRIWIRDIYKRMMKRRYENLESFHASR